MQKLTKAIISSTTLAGMASLAPISVDPGAGMSGGSPVRITEAACQSTTCELGHPNLVCITSWGYITNAKCATGCGS